MAQHLCNQVAAKVLSEHLSFLNLHLLSHYMSVISDNSLKFLGSQIIVKPEYLVWINYRNKVLWFFFFITAEEINLVTKTDNQKKEKVKSLCYL